MHCVDLGESFQTNIWLQTSASIQPRTSPVKVACSPSTDSQVFVYAFAAIFGKLTEGHAVRISLLFLSLLEVRQPFFNGRILFNTVLLYRLCALSVSIFESSAKTSLKFLSENLAANLHNCADTSPIHSDCALSLGCAICFHIQRS